MLSRKTNATSFQYLFGATTKAFKDEEEKDFYSFLVKKLSSNFYFAKSFVWLDPRLR